LRAARVDANQAEIVEALRAIGCKVYVSSGFGQGFPDLVVGYRGRVFLLEVKDGDKPPSAQRLTPDQVKFHAEWAGLPLFVVNSVEAAFSAVDTAIAKG
jgi:Holliday junction resolvase